MEGCVDFAGCASLLSGLSSVARGLGWSSMQRIALIGTVLLGVAALLPSAAHTADSPPSADSGAAARAGPPKGYACHDKALTGSGPGFKSSQEESEEAAINDWLSKASAVFADSDWNTAKDSDLECVKQGLYSKCFATGVPCHPKPAQ